MSGHEDAPPDKKQKKTPHSANSLTVPPSASIGAPSASPAPNTAVPINSAAATAAAAAAPTGSVAKKTKVVSLLPECSALTERLDFVSRVNVRYGDWVKRYFDTDAAPPCSAPVGAHGEANGVATGDAVVATSPTTIPAPALAKLPPTSTEDADRDSEVARDVKMRHRVAADASTSHAQDWIDVAKTGIRLMVFGGKRMGKSTLLSALVGNGHRLLPEREVIESFTMVPTEIARGSSTNQRFVVTLRLCSKNEWMVRKSRLVQALLDEFPLTDAPANAQDSGDAADADTDAHTATAASAATASAAASPVDIDTGGDEDSVAAAAAAANPSVGVAESFDDTTVLNDDESEEADELHAGGSEAEQEEEDDTPAAEPEPETLEQWLRCDRTLSAGNPLRALYRKLDMRSHFDRPGGVTFAEAEQLLRQWLEDPSSDESVVDDLLLDGQSDTDHHASVQFQFDASDDGFRDLNNFLFRVAVDHCSTPLVDELCDVNKQDIMKVSTSLQKFSSNPNSVSPGILDSAIGRALMECMCPSGFEGNSRGSALLSLWPLISATLIEVPASRWSHLPPNVTFFDTPGTSVQMLKAAMARKARANSNPQGSMSKASEADADDDGKMSSDDLAWIGGLEINRVWLVSLPECSGADRSTLETNLSMLASSCLLPATDVIITKIDVVGATVDTKGEAKNIERMRTAINNKSLGNAPAVAVPSAAAAAPPVTGGKRSANGSAVGAAASAGQSSNAQRAVPQLTRACSFHVSTYMF